MLFVNAKLDIQVQFVHSTININSMPSLHIGSRCDVCSDNYYGNPEVPGGKCQPCECSNNIDLFKPGNCDPHTGVCKQCLSHTTGDHCEICEPGYFRLFENSFCERNETVD